MNMNRNRAKGFGRLVAACILLTSTLAPSFGEVVKEVTVLQFQYPFTTDYMPKLIPEFQNQTGIKVVWDTIPEAQLLPKVRTLLGAKSTEYDVIYYRGNLMPEVIKTGAVEPLDQYIATDKTFDRDHFVPITLRMFNYEGKQWGLPGSNGSIVFFYNKDIFAQAGLSAPPRNVEELEKYCQIIFEKTSKAAFALPAMRDSGIIVYPWIFIWKMFAPKWYDSVRGQWFDEKWQPQLANREAVDAVRLWAKILKSYGPKGIAAYGYNECVLDFEQGNLAMYMHGPLWSAEFEDPTKSKVAGKVGYAIIESRAGDDKYIPCVPWGYIMSASVSTARKEAAWKFMNWATSYKISLELGKMGHVENTSLKAMQSPDFEKKVGKELAAALRKASLAMDPAYKPLIPQQGEINDLVAIQLSKVLSQQATPEEAMKEANDKILAIMKRDGYIK